MWTGDYLTSDLLERRILTRWKKRIFGMIDFPSSKRWSNRVSVSKMNEVERLHCTVYCFERTCSCPLTCRAPHGVPSTTGASLLMQLEPSEVQCNDEQVPLWRKYHTCDWNRDNRILQASKYCQHIVLVKTKLLQGLTFLFEALAWG